jgi:hypothetical protein
LLQRFNHNISAMAVRDIQLERHTRVILWDQAGTVIFVAPASDRHLARPQKYYAENVVFRERPR